MGSTSARGNCSCKHAISSFRKGEKKLLKLLLVRKLNYLQSGLPTYSFLSVSSWNFTETPEKNEDIKTGQIEVMKVGEESLSEQCKMQFKLWVVWLTAHFQVSIAEKLDMVTLTWNLASQNLCPPSPHYCCLSHSAPREILTRTQ